MSIYLIDLENKSAKELIGKEVSIEISKETGKHVRGTILDFQLASNPPNLPVSILIKTHNGDIKSFTVIEAKELTVL
jgi:hypothetical protein